MKKTNRKGNSNKNNSYTGENRALAGGLRKATTKKPAAGAQKPQVEEQNG